MAINIKEISFDINHLSIDTSSIQKFIDLANKDFEDSANQFNNELNNHQIYDSHSLLNAPRAIHALFSIYALGIVHCYTLLENNRKEIISKQLQKKVNDKNKRDVEYLIGKLSDSKSIGIILNKVFEITHTSIVSYSLADEFRQVNNAIKHKRFSYSQNINVDKYGIYDIARLKKLYEKHTALREYLVGLNSKCESSLKSESIATDCSLKAARKAIEPKDTSKKNQSNNARQKVSAKNKRRS
ncbi:hypothetical protein H8K38_12665 [Undibacterium sp. FT79W]|uniref:hypothetical protein n=1 Tax=Undibacterium sp. FT79W TaxID=2762296 RepID=UPI00164B1CE8|nr:hypothetical protein [Undibacterium sp. FT79W]MBC3878664.1 hypothetical protein [Undibacterium sp. FT79W]